MSLFRRILGRSADPGLSVSVPPMDGPFQPDGAIEMAEVIAQVSEAEDMVWDGYKIWIAAGCELLSLGEDGVLKQAATFNAPLSAICVLPQGGVFCVVDGSSIEVFGATEWKVGARQLDGREMGCVTAAAPLPDGRVAVTLSSAQNGVEDWARDLLEKRASGAVWILSPDRTKDRQLAGKLAHPFGLCVAEDSLWVSETWAHRILRFDIETGARTILASNLPAYPSRMGPAMDGGIWISFFSARRHLLEFVLQQDKFRKRMLEEVDPKYWIAPMLRSGRNFLEPMQGGNVKVLGISKPWGPPRSYGLIARLDRTGTPQNSHHSRSNGHHHGITAVAENASGIYLLSKGAGRLLRIPTDTTKAVK